MTLPCSIYSSSTVRVVIFSDCRLPCIKTVMPDKTDKKNAPDPQLKVCTGGINVVGSQVLGKPT